MITRRGYAKVFAELNTIIAAYRGLKQGIARTDRAAAIQRITALGFSEAEAKRWLDQSRKRN